MKTLTNLKTEKFSPTIRQRFRRFARIAAAFFVGACAPFAFACKKASPDLFDSVSELRDNILIAQSDEIYLQIYSVMRETPYLADGVRRELSKFAEFHIAAPASFNRIDLAFDANGRSYGGDASYDNVKSEFYFSCSVDLSSVQSLPVTLSYGNNKMALTANTVKTEHTASSVDALNALYKAEKELIDGMSDKYGFKGEIRLRLIYEEAPYYYVGLIEKSGRTIAYLMNAENKKILAKRES